MCTATGGCQRMLQWNIGSFIMSSQNDELLDLRLLSAFQAAMSCGSMTGAARQLGIGQPAVTRLVRELEESVGFRLFHRNGPRISPTERGIAFYEEVDRTMAGVHEIRARAAAIREEREPSIDLAATPTMAAGLVSPTLALMGEPLPASINVQTMNAEHVVRAVRARSAGLGLSSFPLEHDGLARRAVCESVVVAAVSEDDPLARCDVLALTSLTSRRLVTVGNIYRLRRSIDAALAAAGAMPSGTFATNSSLNAVMAVRAGLGVALVDPVTAYAIPVEGVAVRPLDRRIPYLFGLFTAADRVAAPVTERFVDVFLGACEATIPGLVVHDPADARPLARATLGADEACDSVETSSVPPRTRADTETADD